MFLIIFIFFERTAAPPLEPEGVAVLRLIGLRGEKKLCFISRKDMTLL